MIYFFLCVLFSFAVVGILFVMHFSPSWRGLEGVGFDWLLDNAKNVVRKFCLLRLLSVNVVWCRL